MPGVSVTLRIALVQMDLAWEDPAENHRRAARHLETGVARARGSRCCRRCSRPDSRWTRSGSPSRPAARRRPFSASRRRRSASGSSRACRRRASPAAQYRATCLADGRRDALRQDPPVLVTRASTEHYAAGDRVVTVETSRASASPRWSATTCDFPSPSASPRRRPISSLVVANWPEPRREHWRTLLEARAIENQAYVAGVNRVGDGGGAHYAGDSAVIGRSGRSSPRETSGGGRARRRRRFREGGQAPGALPGACRPAASGIQAINVASARSEPAP